MKREGLATLAAFLILGVAARKNVATSEDRKNACTGVEYRQFDFWAEDWDVFDIEEPGPARAPDGFHHL
jgi:hypothetical protein